MPPIRRKPKVKKREEELPQEDRLVVAQEERNTDLEDLLLRMATLKEDAKAFADRNGTEFYAAEKKAIDMMKALGVDRYEGPDITGTYIEAQTTVIDWVGVENELPDDAWNLVSSRSGDKAKLDAWLKANGNTSIGKRVRKHIGSKSSKPYIKATRRTP